MTIEYNFAGIEASAGDIQGASGRTAGLLEEGQASLAKLQAAWIGNGSDSYQAVQQRWDHNSAELNQALNQLGLAIQGAGQHMGTTEQGVQGRFV